MTAPAAPIQVSGRYGYVDLWSCSVSENGPYVDRPDGKASNTAYRLMQLFHGLMCS